MIIQEKSVYHKTYFTFIKGECIGDFLLVTRENPKDFDVRPGLH